MIDKFNLQIAKINECILTSLNKLDEEIIGDSFIYHSVNMKKKSPVIEQMNMVYQDYMFECKISTHNTSLFFRFDKDELDIISGVIITHFSPTILGLVKDNYDKCNKKDIIELALDYLKDKKITISESGFYGYNIDAASKVYSALSLLNSYDYDLSALDCIKTVNVQILNILNKYKGIKYNTTDIETIEKLINIFKFMEQKTAFIVLNDKIKKFIIYMKDKFAHGIRINKEYFSPDAKKYQTYVRLVEQMIRYIGAN